MTEQQPMKKSVPWIFMISSSAQSFATAITSTYLTFYMTDYLGISIAMMGAIMLVSRIADYAVTIVAGAIVQNTNTKRWGQFRPYALLAPIIRVVGTTLIFSQLPVTGVLQAIIVGSGYILAAGAITFVTLMRNGLMTNTAGSNIEDRIAITSKSAQGSRVGGVITAVATAPIIKVLLDRGLNGYFILTMVYNVLWIIPSLYLFFATKEYDSYKADFKKTARSSNINIFQMYLETLKNGPFLALFLAGFVSSVCNTSVSFLNTYYFIYSLEDMNLLAVSSTIAMFVSLVSSFIVTPVSRKLGKRSSAVVSAFVVSIVNVFVALFTDGNFIMKVVLTTITSIVSAIPMAWGVNMYLDTAEYQQYKTGKDTRQFVMSMQNGVSRLGMIVSTPITTYILAASGYDEIARIMASPGTMVKLIGFIPAVGSLVSALIYAFFYKITDAQAQEYAEHNRKAAEEKSALATQG